MKDSVDPLAGIGFIRIPQKLSETCTEFHLDPEIMLPVEFGENKEKWSAANISWEAIITGILRVLIADPGHEHAVYFRKLVVALKPNIKHDFTQAGIIKAKDKDFPIAIEVFEALTALFPQCAASRLNLALVYEDAAEYHKKNNQALFQEYTDSAFTAYKQALTCDPDLAEVYQNLGYFFLKQGSFKKAKEQFSRYLELEKNGENLPRIRKLVADLESLLQLDGLFKEAFDNISMGKEELGIKKITLLLEKNPDFWNGWFLLGWGYRRLKRFADAKQAFLRALEKTEPNPDLLNELAITHMELGELEQSEKQLKRALKLEPHNTKIISNLGVVALKKGDQALAEGYFNSVLEFSPKDAVAQSFLKEIREQKNQ
jgi:tetratricopeptide (TPR) repeat protein